MFTVRGIAYSMLALLIALAGITVLSPAMMGETAHAMELAGEAYAIQNTVPTIQESDTVTETEAGETSDAEDTEVMGDTGAMTGTNAMTDTGAMTGTNAMTDTGAMTGTNTMTNTGAMTGTNTMTNTGTMTGTGVMPEVIIQLGDRAVTRKEFDEAFVRAMHMYAVQQDIPINQRSYDFYTELRSQYLQQFALEQVLLNQAQKLNINVSPAAAKYQILSFRASFPSKQDYQQALQSMGFADEAALIKYVQQTTAIDAVLTRLSADIEVTDEEMYNFYHDNLQLFRVDPGVYLPLEQVQEQVRALLERQQLQQKILDLRDEQAVEIFTGNMTPIEQLVQDQLNATQSASAQTAAPANVGQTATMTDVMSIAVSDQVVAKNTVVVDRVFSVGPGWVVIHADDSGSPGEILGYEAVPDGEMENFAVVLDTEPTGDVLWAMLHQDTGEENTFEFPGGDPPAKVNGDIVMDPFVVLNPPAAQTSQGMTGTVESQSGSAVDTSQGMTGTMDSQSGSAVDTSQGMTGTMDSQSGSAVDTSQGMTDTVESD